MRDLFGYYNYRSWISNL